MTQLAAEEDERLFADDFELRQAQPTRTVHTLTHLRASHPRASLHFIMGMDSFINFTGWLNWQQILELAHLIVLPRPGYRLDQADARLQTLLQRRQRTEYADFSEGAGYVFIADTQPYDVSATELRHQLRHSDTCPDFLSPQVFQYIRTQGLYR
jgi:nicotinate-nucleotide adenylyltransferase